MGETAAKERFRDKITRRFCIGAELVTTRGFVPPEQPNRIVQLGEELARCGRIDWVSVTDNPGGNVMLPPDWLGRLLRGTAVSVVLHMTCKDLNRNGLEARAWQFAAEGFDNIVAMTGDYPRSGFGGTATPVFDLDSVSLIALLQAMNEGLPVPGRKGETTTLPRTDFYIGCVVSPFKRYERELMPQYFKLLRKLSAGARFVYTQLGYDMRKFHEIKLLLEANGYPHVPVIGNVYLLNKTVAGMFHRNEVPGCVVTDSLWQQVEKYGAGPDKGRAFFLEMAAKQLAVFKGLGFAGGYLGGITKTETFLQVIELAEKFGPNDWKEFAREIQFSHPDEFYLFEKDEKTGLGIPGRLNPEYVRSLAHPPKTKHVTLGYRLSRLFHDKVFTPGTPGFRLMQRIYARLDQKQGPLFRGAHELEKLSKFVWFGCRDCGDCSLPETGYLCPMVSCSKGARNGPCGGSAEGDCETGDKECIWARAYERMKYFHESEQMLRGKPVFYNARLRGTSAWANTFLGRDHAGANGSNPPSAERPPETKPVNPPQKKTS